MPDPSIKPDVQIFHGLEGEPVFTDEWWQLFERSAAAVPLSPAWIGAWIRLFARPGEVRIVAFRRGERLIGIAPLYLRQRMHRNLLPVRSLEWLGTGEREEHEVCSEYVGLLAEPELEDEVSTRLARVIASGKLGAFDQLHLSSMAGDRPQTTSLAAALVRAGLRVDRSVESVCHHVELPHSFDAYLESLSGSRRRRVRRSIRKLEESLGELELKRATSADEQAQARQILERLHGDRWSDEGEDGVFDSPLFQCFHATVLPELASRGCAEILTLYAGGEPMASLYNLVSGSRVQFYQSGRRTDLPNALRPGVVVHALAIQDAIARGLREYDFLAGDRRYKRELSLRTRELVTIRAETRGAVMRARRFLESGARVARRARERSKALVAQVDRHRGQQRSRAAHG